MQIIGKTVLFCLLTIVALCFWSLLFGNDSLLYFIVFEIIICTTIICEGIQSIVQKIDDGNTGCNRRDHHHDSGIGFHSFRNKVKTDHTQHDTSSKTQQQADRSVGIFLQQRAKQAAKTRSANTSDRRNDQQRFYRFRNKHPFLSAQKSFFSFSLSYHIFPKKYSIDLHVFPSCKNKKCTFF